MCDTWIAKEFLPALIDCWDYKGRIGYDGEVDFLTEDEELHFEGKLFTAIDSGVPVADLYVRKAVVLFCKELDIRCPFEEVADKKWWKKFIVKHPFLYVALFPDHKPQRQPCDWNIDGDDKLQDNDVQQLKDVKVLDPNTEIIDFNEDGFLIIRERKSTDHKTQVTNMGLWWWRNQRGFIAGNSVGYYSNITPQTFASKRLTQSQSDMINRLDIGQEANDATKRGCSIEQELKEGLTMHPNEAMDLGLPMAREGVARKIKWLTRRFLRSRCSLAPNTVKAKAECIVRIVATLILKFKDLKNDRNMEPTPFLAVKDKHGQLLSELFVEAPDETYKMSDLYDIYKKAVEKNDRQYDPANFGILVKIIFSSKVWTRHTTEKNKKQVTIITGIKPKSVCIEQHYMKATKLLFQRFLAEECLMAPNFSIRTENAHDAFLKFLKKEQSHLIVSSRQFGILMCNTDGVKRTNRVDGYRLYQGVGLKVAPTHWSDKLIINDWFQKNVTVDPAAIPIKLEIIMKLINDHTKSLGIARKITTMQFATFVCSEKKEKNGVLHNIYSNRLSNITYYHGMHIHDPNVWRPWL